MSFDEQPDPLSDCMEAFDKMKARAEKAEAQVKALAERLEAVCEQRDAAEAKWHAHQKNVPCAGCEGGHDTFWKSVVESPQWKAWEESHPKWDVDECRECGHISQAHFQAFMGFAAAKTKRGEAGE